MNDCRDIRPLLPLLVDGELPARDVAVCEAHARDCAECRALLRGEQALSRAAAKASYARAPEALSRGLKAALAAQRPRPEPRPGRALEWALSGLLGGALAFAAAALVVLPGRSPSAPEELVSSHLRSLQPGHLMDVVSTDQHTVKPWFDGRVGFAPQVRDLASDGFPLVGGRLDFVGGRQAAAMVYQRRKHLINVFAWARASGGPSPSRAEVRGYHELGWVDGDVAYAAVSDLNEDELRRFVELLRAPR